MRPREELAKSALVRARIAEDEHIARVDIRQGQREHMKIGSYARLQQHEIVVAESGREPLEPGNQIRILDMVSNRQRCGQIAMAQQQRGENAGDTECNSRRLARIKPWPFQPERREHGRRCKDQRAGQDFREETACKPEVFCPDPHLVEEDRRQRSDHQDERGRTPERSPYQHRVTGQGKSKPHRREIQGCRRYARSAHRPAPGGLRVPGKTVRRAHRSTTLAISAAGRRVRVAAATGGFLLAHNSAVTAAAPAARNSR